MFRMAGRPHDERPVGLDADRSAVEAARREPRQFETLYRKYVGQVYSYAFYELRDRQAAEDLTAQVFLQALAALPRFQDRTDEMGGASSFRVWLFRIARNLVSNERRSRRRHPTAPMEAAEFVAGPGDPAAAAAERDDVRRAWEVVSRLPDDRRRAVVLRFVHEMTPGEIGAILGRSEGSVRVLIHRALRNVAEELRRSHPAGPGADA